MRTHININMSRYHTDFAIALTKFLKDWGFDYCGAAEDIGHVVSVDYVGKPVPPKQNCAAKECKHEKTIWYGDTWGSWPKPIKRCLSCGVLLGDL